MVYCYHAKRLYTGLVDRGNVGQGVRREGQQGDVLVPLFQPERQAALVQEPPRDLPRTQVQLRRRRRGHAQAGDFSRVARGRRAIHMSDRRQGDVRVAHRRRFVSCFAFRSFVLISNHRPM